MTTLRSHNGHCHRHPNQQKTPALVSQSAPTDICLCVEGESWRTSFSGGGNVLPVPPLQEKESQGSEIAEFYDGRSIFITGATGFMGKVSIGKK